MKTICATLIVTCLLLDAAFAGEVRIHGGILRIEGEVRAGQVILQTNATLCGNGTLRGNLLARGTVMPGAAAALNVGALRVAGNLNFDAPGKLVCDATDNTTLDRLVVTGAVAGVCAVVVVTNSAGVIPLDQLIVLGNAASDYASFSPSNAYLWRLAETGAVNLALTHLRGDTDGDGLPDWWENAHWGTRTAGASGVDSDGDGVVNLAEYYANTDPSNATSALRFTQIRPVSTNLQVTWTTSDGRRYALLSFTNLVTDAGTTAAVFTVYGQPEHSWTDAVSAAGIGYYRIRVEENLP